MPPVKLAVEVTTCTADRAGVGTYTEHLADALIATAGPQDEVLLIGNRAVAPELAGRWAGRLHIGGARRRYFWMQRDAARLLEQTGADLALFPNYLAPLASPCPYVTVVHDLAIYRTPQFFTLGKRALMKPLLPLVTRGAAAVATVSAASRADLGDLLAVPDERILMLPGAPHPACRPADPAAVAAVRARFGLQRPYLLTVGTLEPRKNLPLLLRAFDRLSGAGVEGAVDLAVDLAIVGGKGWRDAGLRAELQRRLPAGRVRVLGYVSQEDLIALYGGALAMAYPSHFEGFGLPVVEAMACGTPVVATDVPALREAAGGAAVLVPPGDEAGLAAALRRLVADPEARAQARAQGLRRAGQLSWEASARRLWSFGRGLRVRTAPPRTAAAPAAPAGADLRDWAIAATVAYADLFDAAIPAGELARACWGARLDAAEIRRRVARAPLSALVTADAEGVLTLRGREALAARRAEGAARTEALLRRHRRVIAALASLPYIRMLALSGGTAHRNARGGDDIDLFVVAAAGRVFTAYTLLFLASRLTRTRGIVCPNYLVDENNLQIAYHHDLFTAHQALSLVPIAGPSTFARFVEANRGWVQAHYPGYLPRAAAAELAPARWQRWAERALGLGGDALEQALGAAWRYRLGRRAARARSADVVLSGGVLKMHLSDHRRRVLDRFAARLDDLRARWPAAARDAATWPASA